MPLVINRRLCVHSRRVERQEGPLLRNANVDPRAGDCGLITGVNFNPHIDTAAVGYSQYITFSEQEIYMFLVILPK